MDIKQNIKDAQIDLAKKLGIDKLPEDKQEESLLQIGEVLQQRILIRVVEEFPDEHKDELLKTIEKQKETSTDDEKKEMAEEVEALIMKHLPNVEDLILDEVGKYKRESIELMNEMMSGGDAGKDESEKEPKQD